MNSGKGRGKKGAREERRKVGEREETEVTQGKEKKQTNKQTKGWRREQQGRTSLRNEHKTMNKGKSIN